MSRRRGVLLALILASLAFSLSRFVKESLDVLGMARGPIPPHKAFLEVCRSRVPAEARVFLIAGTVGPIAATALYPRSVRAWTAERLDELKTQDPEAWVIVYPSPFLQEKASCQRVRDLP